MKFRQFSVAIFAASAVLMFAPNARAIQRAELMLEVGKWKVFRADAKEGTGSSCFAIYGREADVQMWPIGLFLKFPETVDQVDLAFDHGAFRGLRPTSAEERKFNLVRLADEELKSLLGAREVRVRILTESKQKLSRTLEASGAKEAHAYLVSGCPGKPPQAPPKGCEAGLEQTMRGRGVSEDDIAELCGKPSV
jgi:hypothetical protein